MAMCVHVMDVYGSICKYVCVGVDVGLCVCVCVCVHVGVGVHRACYM